MTDKEMLDEIDTVVMQERWKEAISDADALDRIRAILAGRKKDVTWLIDGEGCRTILGTDEVYVFPHGGGWRIEIFQDVLVLSTDVVGTLAVAQRQAIAIHDAFRGGT